MLKKFAFIPLAALLVTGCTNEEVGTLFGAAAGAAIGTQFGNGGAGTSAAIAGFTLAGAFIGREVGRGMDERDRARMHSTTQYALERNPSGRTSSWTNPDSGNYGTVTPEPVYRNAQGENCRPFTQTVTVDGKSREVHGTACRQPDGSWYIVDTGS